MNPTHNPPAEPIAEPVDITPAGILRGAALYLERHGWLRGVYYGLPEDGPFPAACAVGAISIALYGHRDAVPSDRTDSDRANWRLLNRTLDTLTDYLGLTDPADCPPFDYYLPATGVADTPYAWNDQPSRTAEQVITTLRAAADEYDRTHTGGAR